MHVGLIPALGLSWAALGLAMATPAGDPPMKFVAPLSGTAEVPGPGDPDATGMAHLTFRPEANEVCYEIKASNLDKPTEAHIHTGTPGTEGAVVLTLTKNLERQQKGCARADGDLLRKIAENPTAYYVNVHTDQFKKGAARGQLQPEGTGADTGGMGINKPGGPDSLKPYPKARPDSAGINRSRGPDSTRATPRPSNAPTDSMRPATPRDTVPKN